jgi:hypothetical protein
MGVTLAGRASIGTVALIMLADCCGDASAQATSADRLSNIQKAASEIGAIQKQNGADGAFVAITECYRRELAKAKSLTRELEACMAQDIIVTNVSASMFASVSEEARRMAKAPDPEALKKAMIDRVLGTFMRFKIPVEEARRFNQVVQTQGMEAYGRAMFPDHYRDKK